MRARTCEPMRVRHVALALLVLAVVVASGAATGGAAPAVTLEFWTISLQPFFNDYINGIIAAYERDHPGVDIRWVDVQFAAVEQRLLSAIAGGVPPDVANLNVELTIRLADRNALVDMDAAVPADVRGRYFDGLWRSMQVRGRAYAVPWYVTP